MALVIAIALAAVVVYGAVNHVPPIFSSSGCHVGTGQQAVTLQPDQAANAAVIAAVAHQRGMPRQAVTIAYAAAMQESHLHNFGFGDRDSVGIFQQRPSQGWGPAAKLRDPVYAATKFFTALKGVRGYRQMPVYRAAQAVQRSADGYAYVQYQRFAAGLTGAFTGKDPHAVWCWPATTVSGKKTRPAKVAAARSGLVKAFGPLDVSQPGTAGDAPSLLVRPGDGGTGWSVAAWLITHASEYRLHEVRYAGLWWRSSSARAGWAPVKAAGVRGDNSSGGTTNAPAATGAVVAG